jgi:putative ABC transport system permease protein
MRGPATNNTTGKKRYVEFCSFREELLQSPYFKSVTATMNVPGQSNRHKNIIVHRNGERVDASFNISMADENYFETYQVPVIEGRNFSKSIDNERGSIVINEKAMEAMGFESGIQAIGKKVKVRGQEKEIIGIVKNFHHESLQKALEPYLYEFRHPHEFGYYPALVSTENIQEAINTAERAWENHYPEAQTDFFFLDEFFNRQYLSYSKLGKLVGISTFLAIFIACLGLFALVSYTVNKKVKEIGVRKVNGATVTEILTMLNTDFVKWVVIAFVIACPISIYGMNKWLENFAYKTTLSWWVFALAGVLTFGIALLTVSRQSWLAATRNPVEALRYE